MHAQLDSHAAGSVRDRLIREAEIEAERTVAVLRMLMALGLLALVTAAIWSLESPLPALMRPQVGMAIVVLAAYFALGLVSWHLARPERLRPWMPWAFTTADAMLLLFNVAYNASSLGVSLAFAAAFPVLWLVPLTLSFTTLRYRPGLQAYNGLLLVGGLLVLAVVQAEPPSVPPPLETFGWPPNVMRLAMVAGFAAVLVLAAQRRRALLARAVAETERSTEYQRYLPPSVAEMVADGEVERLRRGWRCEAAIMFVDIRGFTAAAEGLAPEELGRLVTVYRRRLGEVVRAHGGIVDKFVGDGAMVLFGVIDIGRAPARDAIACAQAMPRALDQIEGHALRLAIGVHWGEVYAAAVGDDSRLEFTVLGDAVNVAARLEDVAKSLDEPVVITTALLAVGNEPPANWHSLGVRALRGRAGQIELWGLRRCD